MTKPQKTFIFCITFITGIAAYFLHIIPFMAVIFLILISFLSYKKIFSIKFSLLCLLIAAFSVFYCAYRTPTPDALSKIAPAKINLKGRVISEPDITSTGGTKFEFKVYSLSATPIKTKTIVNIYDKTNIKIGDILEIKGYIKAPYEATNPSQFDYKKYLKNQGIFTLTSVKSNNFKIIEHPKSGKWFVIQKLNGLKNIIVEKNRKYIKSPHLEVLEGMVLGNYAVPVPENIKQDFIKSGLLHLLAASGMNVGFIFGFWFFFASILKIPYRSKIITGMVLVAFYSLLTGLPPSVMRAAVMAEFLLLGKLLDRKADSLILLIAVCALMLLIDPFLLTNVSFQLSYITTFGLLLCIPPLMEKIKNVPEFLSGALLIPIIAQLWASPVQMFHFNNFAIYSVPANIVVLPFTGIITYIGFIGNMFGLLPLIGDKICWLTAVISKPFIDITLFVSNYVSNLPGALYYFAKPNIAEIAIFYSLVIAVLYAIVKNFSSACLPAINGISDGQSPPFSLCRQSAKKLNIAALALLLSLLIFVFKDNFNKNLEFVFFDVGQGDGIYVHTPNNKNFLVDTGATGKYLPAKTAIVPYLRARGINTLDAVVLTHQDSDHTGGALQILKNIKVNNVFHNGLSDDTKFNHKLKNYIIKNNVKNTIVNTGQVINFDNNMTIRVVRSQNTDKNTDNEDGIMLYITYNKFSALLMADCEAESIYEIKKYVNKPVNLLKIGHHGSYNSVNYHFLDYLKPELAIISVGKRGYKYGHPNKQVLNDLKDFNVKTLRTDKDYAITVNSDGNNYSFKTFKNQKNR